MHPHYHFIGIGGIGMSALARILLQKGIKVSGSDLTPSYTTDLLQGQGATIYFGHAPENVEKECAVVYSTMIKETNPEVKQARTFELPFLHRSELLAHLMHGYAALLVAGTHGKTTTSSLLSHVLVSAGLNPAYAIGGMVKSLESNGGHGTGPYFVAEADESDGSFLKYDPFGAIITNIENDHLDYWKGSDSLVQGFMEFAKKVSSPEHLFWCGDDQTLLSLHLPGYSYGFGSNNALRIDNFSQTGWKNTFDMTLEGNHFTDIEIPLVGAHNVLNAAAVFGMCLKLNVAEKKIRKGLQSFQGVSRRAELKGEVNQISVFDDYAHHPTEIFSTLRAIKQAIGQRRLVVAFQPHRYTRTRDCLNEFGPSFVRADAVILTDIYGAQETPIEGITTEALMQKIQEHSAAEMHYAPRSELTSYLRSFLKPDDVLVTMGAGDITAVGSEIIEQMKK
ncbi:MAG: UDP-N-acetylmuramate--L-alanine ligase [Chlamydiota bacterium]